MTWDEFIVHVEKSIAEEKIQRDLPIGWVSWDRTLFGGPIPDVYVQVLRDEDGSFFLGIGED